MQNMNENRSKGLSREQQNSKNSSFRIMLFGASVMLGMAAFCIVFFMMKLNQVRDINVAEHEVYDRHYAFITDSTESEFWDVVYNSAREEGERSKVYVERLGANLSTSYEASDLLRMAINSSVDGIIICGKDDEETKQLIAQAVEQDIGVITLRQDIEGSARQCFVGVNNYDLGREFGKQLLQLQNSDDPAKQKVFILMDDTTTESRQSIITLAIQECFSDDELMLGLFPDIEIRIIDTKDAFGAEEAIRNIFMDEENLPDVIVCSNSIYTECTYQAAVDHNRVGDIKILGYYSSDTILQAVEKEIITATVNVDTVEMGRQSVKALNEYLNTGYTSTYIPVSTSVIGKTEATKLLQEESMNESIGN